MITPLKLLFFSGLRYALEAQLYGQHLVIETTVRSIKAHFENENPKKALVLSFHGWTGGGKNYVASIIAQNLFKKGMKSHFVHLMVGTMHFAHKDEVEIYKVKKFWSKALKCSLSLDLC
jgi:pantothenate kinase-related protein Tda10